MPRPLLRPHLRLVLAISLDGRLAPPQGGAAQIGGRGDRRVLEEALAWADGALIGAETLRRHGCTCLIHAQDLLEQRRQRGVPLQPHALVVSRSGRIPAQLPFFAQPLQRWLLLVGAPAQEGLGAPPTCVPAPVGLEAGELDVGVLEAGALQAGFDRVQPLETWEALLHELAAAGLQRLVVLGGALLAGSLLAQDRLDELQLTLCPVLLGGEHSWLAPGLPLPEALRAGWQLLEQRVLPEGEVLLRYGRLGRTQEGQA